MKNKSKNFKHVQSLKIELSDLGNTLMNVLELVINPWIENGCDLSTTGINMLIIKNYEELQGKKLKKRKPFLYFYPCRDETIHPIAGFKKPISLFTDDFQKLSIIDKKNVLLKTIKGIITDYNFMKAEREKYKKTLAPSQLGQGDGAWDSFIIYYDINYYNSHFCLSLSRYYTPA